MKVIVQDDEGNERFWLAVEEDLLFKAALYPAENDKISVLKALGEAIRLLGLNLQLGRSESYHRECTDSVE